MSYILQAPTYIYMTYTAGNIPHLKKDTHDIHLKFLTQKKKKEKKKRGHRENVRYLCVQVLHMTHILITLYK